MEAGIRKLPVHHSVSETIDRLAAPSPDHFTGTVKSTSTSPNGKTVIEIKTSGKMGRRELSERGLQLY